MLNKYPSVLMSRFLIIMAAMIIFSCDKDDNGNSSVVIPRGSRILGMDCNNPSPDFTFTQGYEAAMSIGVRAGTVHTTWSANEAAGSGTTSGVFTDTSDQLASANAYYPNTTPASFVSLTLAVIDTVGPKLPSDISTLQFDNADVVARFKNYVDWVYSKMPGTSFTSIQVGNEIDLPAGAGDAAYWNQYRTFLTEVVPYIKTKWPGVKVGVTVTLYGLTGEGSHGDTAKTGILSLLSEVDVIGITYYPFEGSFAFSDPSVVFTDFDKVFNLIGAEPVYIQEAGYATSSVCGGSEYNQRIFIRNIFSVWDNHASQMPYVSFLRLNDLSHPDAVTTAGNYGLGGNAAFIAYLETIGLRTYTTPSSFKQAWSELQSATGSRGW